MNDIQKGTIMVAEDDDLVRMMIVSAVKNAGYAVVEANSGQEAIDIVLQNRGKIDMSIIDLRMQPKTGLDFLYELETEDISMPCIMVTVDDSSDVLIETSKYKNIVRVMKKPVKVDDLQSIIDRVFRKIQAA